MAAIMPSGSRRLPYLVVALVVAALVPAFPDTPFAHFYERIIYKNDVATSPQFVDVVENRSGVITVSSNGTVYGSGLYEGRLSVDLVDDINQIIRPFSLSFFHPSPREVLMIGLATGAWAQVIANHPMVERLTVIEINPGYLDLIRRHAVLASLLGNPKVEIIIDDGRRWLRRNPDRTFDAVVQNSPWYFRPNATHILSAEYLDLVRHHLRDGGVMMYSAQQSTRVMLTGCMTFAHGLRQLSMMVGSQSPLRLDTHRLGDVLIRYTIDGRPTFDFADQRHRARFEEIMTELDSIISPKRQSPTTLETCESVKARSRDMEIVTDDNMGEEWG